MNRHCRSSLINHNALSNHHFHSNNNILPNNSLNCNQQNVLSVQDTCTNEKLLDSLCCCVRKKVLL